MGSSTLPDLTGFTTYYGVQVTDIGEDGDLLVLGHHDPLRVIAAMNRHTRTHWGFAGLLDDRQAGLADLAGMFQEAYGVLVDRCDDPNHEDDCWRCEEIAGGDWWIDWSGTSTDLKAFPVTIWRA